MKWFEYVIIIITIGYVILPIVLTIINKKKGKHNCNCECSCCSMKGDCYKNFKKFIENEKKLKHE